MTRHGVTTETEETQEFDEESFRELIRENYEVPSEAEFERIIERGRIAWERYDWVGADWPRPDPGPDAKKVAIVGFGRSRSVAPYGEDGWELWCLNDPMEKPGIPARHAFTRWFQIHPPHYLAKHYPRGLEDLARWWGEPTGIRLYMDRHYDEYPDSEPYPKDEVEALTRHGWFHASSFDWMLALAIHEGFEEIGIYGCEFWRMPKTNGEPLSALDCLSYWCGVAEGRGIKLDAIQAGGLFQVSHLAIYQSGLQYGFEREPALDLGTDVDPNWKDYR